MRGSSVSWVVSILSFAIGCKFDPHRTPLVAFDAPADVDLAIDDSREADPDASSSTCDPPFVSSTFGCHRFLQPATNTFSGGRAQCQAIGADLVIAPTVGESMYVATMSGIAGPDARTLLGLSLQAGMWTWIDGSIEPGGLWIANEPEVGEDMGVLTPAGTWVGRNVTEAFIVACEK